MTERLEEIRARVEAATPGPWYPQPGYVMRSESGVHPEVCLMRGPEHTGVGSSDAVSDGAFIAHAREDVPYLLDRLERAEARAKTLELVAAKARGLVRTAHVEVGKREVVRQWWDSMVEALAALETGELPPAPGRYCSWCGQLDDWCEDNIERTHGACCKSCTHSRWHPATPFGLLETGEPHG